MIRNDETTRKVADAVTLWQARHVDIKHIPRKKRCGYKAGALAKRHASEPRHFIAIFDADFVPPSNFLRAALPYFVEPSVGLVQARWRHLNEAESFLTRAQSIMLNCHFEVEHWVRDGLNWFILMVLLVFGVVRRLMMLVVGWTTQ